MLRPRARDTGMKGEGSTEPPLVELELRLLLYLFLSLHLASLLSLPSLPPCLLSLSLSLARSLRLSQRV